MKPTTRWRIHSRRPLALCGMWGSALWAAAALPGGFVDRKTSLGLATKDRFRRLRAEPPRKAAAARIGCPTSAHASSGKWVSFQENVETSATGETACPRFDVYRTSPSTLVRIRYT